MPLVILTGYPLAGKTRFAHELKEKLQGAFQEIEIINDQSLNIDKHFGYMDATAEKKSRAAFQAAIERRISKTRLIIADSSNHIKGFRYQLYCVSRACSTPHCCIQVLGAEKEQDARYQEMVNRYEEPVSTNRWDSPLFYVQPDGTFSQFEEVELHLKGQPTKQPSLATRKAAVPPDYIQVLETRCRLALETYSLDPLNKKHSPAEMQKLKRQFIQMNRQTACRVEDIERLLIEYLNKQ